jgi:hypothetical protein
VTHLDSSSRTTAEASVPSAFALASTAVHRVSSMRTFRSLVPLGIDGTDVARLEGADGKVFVPCDGVAPRDVLHDCPEVSGLDVLDARSGIEGSGEGGDDWCAHGIECTYTCCVNARGC